MNTYQTEPWIDIRERIAALAALNYREVYGVRDFALDLPKYDILDANDMLVVTTVRQRGSIVGYSAAHAVPHPHERHVTWGLFDATYIAPAFRGPRVAMRLIGEAERALAERGVRRMHAEIPLSSPAGPLFDHLGWREYGKTYLKELS